MRKLGKRIESRHLRVTSGEELGSAFLAHPKQYLLLKAGKLLPISSLPLSLKPFWIIDCIVSRTPVISSMVE
jgi:hypothetical protein